MGTVVMKGDAACRAHTPKVFASMWDKILHVVTEVIVLGAAIFVFATTCEPLRLAPSAGSSVPG